MNRTNVVLLGIFAALLAMVLILENPFQETRYDLTQKSNTALFPGFVADEALKIEISKAGEQVVVERDSSGHWALPSLFGYRAQEGRVQGLLQNIAKFKSSNLLETEVDDLDKIYSVGEKGYRVKVYGGAGKLLADFVRGDIPVDWKDKDAQRRLRKLSAYVRKSDEKKVYLVEDFPPLVVAAKDWADTSLIRFDSSKVQEIELVGKLVEGEITLQKTGEEWTLVKPEQAIAKKEVAAAMVRSFSSAYFKELVGKESDLSQYELESPQLKVRMKLETGEEHELWIGKKLEDNSYFARKGQKDPFVYKLHSYTVDALKKTLNDLKFVPPPPPETPQDPNSSEGQGSDPKVEKGDAPTESGTKNPQ